MRNRGDSDGTPFRYGSRRGRGAHVRFEPSSTPDGVAAAPERGPNVQMALERGRQWLAFAFEFDESLNSEIRRLPGRRFDWEDKRWLVPADRRLGAVVLELFERHPWLEVSEAVKDWVETFSGWFGEVTATEGPDGPAFAISTVGGEPPERLLERALEHEDALLLPMTRSGLELIESFDNVELDELATECAEAIEAGRVPPAATLELEIAAPGVPEFQLHAIWGVAVREQFARLPEARIVRERAGEFYVKFDAEILAVPADPAAAPDLAAFLDEHPEVVVGDEAHAELYRLNEEHRRREETVALSQAEDAELEIEGLGGVLRPFQRAGVAYALRQRRTFIADEQGLGKTVQALAALELDDAYPAVVVCPASIKLNWEREAHIWLPERRIAVIHGRTLGADDAEAVRDADVIVVNYEILDAHLDSLARRRPRAAVFDESHYAKQPRARRTKAALALAHCVPADGLKLALTGTPVMNRPNELVSQLRLLDRLSDFGSGAELTRRFATHASHDRLHWNLRAHCYVRRLKVDVLPQLPEKSHETVVVEIDNEQEYRLAERDVVAWLQSQPLDLGTIEAKISAALRAERLARLNYLRQLSGRGKLAASLHWIEDFTASGEPLVVFADHIEIQKAVLKRFPHAVHVLGSDSAAERDAAVRAFQEPDGPELIVCSLKAGSHGITLTRASNVAFLELDWTPARLEQAEDRTHRIGQRNAVTAWYLLAPNTIDTQLEGVLEAKRELIGAITDGRVDAERTVLDSVIRSLRGSGAPVTDAA